MHNDILNIKNSYWIEIPTVVDGYDGILSIIEHGEICPFDIKRVYYIYNLMKHKMIRRGKHAHKELEQILLCLNGSCNITLDDGINKQCIHLDNPNKGIFIGKRVWHDMFDFNSNCILLVLASCEYNESDYIRDYVDFLKYMETDHDIIE